MIEFLGPEGQSWPVHEYKMYSDNTPLMKHPDWEEIVEHANAILIQTTDITELFVGLAAVRAIDNATMYNKIETLYLPYIPGARQDRSNPTGDVLATLALVGDMINAQKFKRVVAVDPHSSRSNYYVNHLEDFPLDLIYSRLWKGYSGVIRPDEGASIRSIIALSHVGGDYVKASKTRDVSTGKLTGFEVEVEAGKHYIIVDDLCDGGGTFVGLGEKIRAQGAFADLFVTHGLFSKGTGDLHKIFKNIYTTNTVFQRPENNVMVFDIIKELKNA